jgi:hypothetical protein
MGGPCRWWRERREICRAGSWQVGRRGIAAIGMADAGWRPDATSRKEDSMMIDNRPVRGSGTLVVRRSETGLIQIDGKHFPLRFDDSGPEVTPEVTVVPSSGMIQLIGCNNPLGSYVGFELSSPDHAPVQVTVAVYSLGTPSAVRVVHYTAF